MIVEFEGRSWQLDTDRISYKHAMVIQLSTGLSMAEWEGALAFEPDEDGGVKPLPAQWLPALGALYWLMLAQNDVKAPIADIDFDFQAFMVAIVEARVREYEQARAQADAEPDPTSSPSSQPGDQPSPVPAYPTVTTPTPDAPLPADPGTGFTPPATWPGYAPSTYSASPTSAISAPPTSTS